MEGDQLDKAVENAVKQYTKRIRLIPDDIEDIRQDVVTKYLEAWGDGPGPDNPAAWLNTVTQNLLRDRARAAPRKPVLAGPEGSGELVNLLLEQLRRPQPASLLGMRGRLFDDVMALLSEEEAELIRRHYVDDESPAQLAEDLGRTVAAIEKRLSRARQKLGAGLKANPELMYELGASHPEMYGEARRRHRRRGRDVFVADPEPRAVEAPDGDA